MTQKARATAFNHVNYQSFYTIHRLRYTTLRYPSLKLGLATLEARRDARAVIQEVGRILKIHADAHRHRALSSPLSTVNRDNLAVDIRAALAEEEDSGIRNILYGAHAAAGDLRRECRRVDILACQTVHAFCLGNRARGNDVALHTSGAVFERNRSAERVDGRLGSRDVRLERHTGVVESGGDVDDASVFATEKVRHGGLDGVEGAQDVNVHDGLEGVAGHTLHGGDKVASCASATSIC